MKVNVTTEGDLSQDEWEGVEALDVLDGHLTLTTKRGATAVTYEADEWVAFAVEKEQG